MVGHGHLYIFHYLILSCFLHFTIGPISEAHLSITTWPTPVEDHCGHYIYCKSALMVLKKICNEIPGVHLKQGYMLDRWAPRYPCALGQWPTMSIGKSGPSTLHHERYSNLQL